MNLTYSNKKLIIWAVIELALGLQSLAWADDEPDQQQKDADLATAAQLKHIYESNQQSLNEAYETLKHNQRAGRDTRADQEAVRNLKAVLRNDVDRMKENAKDLQEGGLSMPYTIPSKHQTYSKQRHASKPSVNWHKPSQHRSAREIRTQKFDRGNRFGHQNKPAYCAVR